MPAEQNYPPYPTQPNVPVVSDEQPVLLPKRERLFTKATLALVVLLVATGSFALGAHLKHSSTATAASGVGTQGNAATSGRTAGTTGTGAANGAAGGAGVAGGFGGATVGQITKIDGSTIYLQDTQGNTVTVNTSASTPINVAKPGTVADLTNGESIIVQGTAGASGSITATSINAGAAFGARGATGGRGANGAGQTRGTVPTTTTG